MQNFAAHHPQAPPAQRWYVVFRGTEQGIFTDWSSAAARVLSVTGTIHRRYGRLEDAQAALAAFNAQEADAADALANEMQGLVLGPGAPPPAASTVAQAPAPYHTRGHGFHHSRPRACRHACSCSACQHVLMARLEGRTTRNPRVFKGIIQLIQPEGATVTMEGDDGEVDQDFQKSESMEQVIIVFQAIVGDVLVAPQVFLYPCQLIPLILLSQDTLSFPNLLMSLMLPDHVTAVLSNVQDLIGRGENGNWGARVLLFVLDGSAGGGADAGC
ncbi:hypothetical protein BV25DRAFT_1920007 [Artomyces pyxidatus]|uniref:Uncharacterized protein n=1 Tax=Artomyces pyxidatus TaxID=48021 RepID=A0ACB8SNA7_9AGAM|nr:hypothetical protein BV25DRAFT_1920007 [Artomyces pyxidatus]